MTTPRAWGWWTRMAMCFSPDERVGRCVPLDGTKLSGGQTETVPYAIPHTITTDADGARSVHAADVDG